MHRNKIQLHGHYVTFSLILIILKIYQPLMYTVNFINKKKIKWEPYTTNIMGRKWKMNVCMGAPVGEKVWASMVKWLGERLNVSDWQKEMNKQRIKEV